MTLLRALQRGGWLRAVDHELALALQRLRPDSDDRVLAAAALASRALAFGHGALPLDRVRELFDEIAADHDAPALPSAAAWQDALRASPWTAAGGPLVLDDARVYLRRYHDYEVRLANALLARCSPRDASIVQPDLFARPSTSRNLPEILQDPQSDAIARFRDTRLLLLTGGPGTGKTTTVARALVVRIEATLAGGAPAPRIALAAPTGKAAARLAEAVREAAAAIGSNPAVASALPTEAFTLHRLLGWRGHGAPFVHDASRPLPHDVVVVDEASMVDLPMMCKLVEAIAPSAALLLVGDRDQLPSVETGDVLASLCDAADAGGPLAPHRIALTRTWRQHGDLDVATLAAHVRKGEVEGALDALQAGASRGIRWHAARERSPWPAVEAFALPAYRAVAQAASPREALLRARAARVLTAVREGVAGSVTLNAQIAAALPSPGERGEPLFHGALVIVTENSYRHGLFNGDVGVAWRDDDGTLRVWFERDDDVRAWLPGALPAHEAAFALTVHKSQGSEFDAVMLVLPPGRGGVSRALSRELLYTGLTRCRRALDVWADEDALRAAIARRAARWSGLAARLSASS